MADFSTSGALEIRPDSASLRRTRAKIEAELGDISVSVSGGGGVASSMRTDGGRSLGATGQGGLSSLAKFAEERNDLLGEILDTLEDGGGLGGGGGGGGGGFLPSFGGGLTGGAGAGLGGSLLGGVLGGGAAAAGGGIASLLGLELGTRGLAGLFPDSEFAKDVGGIEELLPGFAKDTFPKGLGGVFAQDTVGGAFGFGASIAADLGRLKGQGLLDPLADSLVEQAQSGLASAATSAAQTLAGASQPEWLLDAGGDIASDLTNAAAPPWLQGLLGLGGSGGDGGGGGWGDILSGDFVGEFSKNFLGLGGDGQDSIPVPELDMGGSSRFPFSFQNTTGGGKATAITEDMRNLQRSREHRAAIGADRPTGAAGPGQTPGDEINVNTEMNVSVPRDDKRWRELDRRIDEEMEKNKRRIKEMKRKLNRERSGGRNTDYGRL